MARTTVLSGLSSDVSEVPGRVVGHLLLVPYRLFLCWHPRRPGSPPLSLFGSMCQFQYQQNVGLPMQAWTCPRSVKGQELSTIPPMFQHVA